MSEIQRAHLCLTCRYALWERSESGRLTGTGFCAAPDPALPALPAVKWWNSNAPCGIRGGPIYRSTKFPVVACDFHEQGGR